MSNEIEFSPQQAAAIKDVARWLKDKNGPQVYRLFGFAGTGKTTLAKEIAKEVDDDVIYGAFTGKAASVMRQKGCTDAMTIHSMIYDFEQKANGEMVFTLKPSYSCDVKLCKLVILDEVSMVDEPLATDLLSFGTKILALGDPAQLPPVSGAGYFTEAEPDTMLTEVHRQARENPIIELSMKIRNGGSFEAVTRGDLRIITKAELQPSDVLNADQVLVGLNRTRITYNKRIRQLLQLPSDIPVTNDRLICLKNDRSKNIFNGGMWAVEKIMKDKKGKPIYHMLLKSQDSEKGDNRGVQVRHEFFNGTEADLPWQEKKGTQEFTYGYAITCHKSQGSQWDHVTVFNEGACFRDDYKRWLYTAVTRAAHKLTVVM